jgi:hypothetical protein
MKQSVFFYCVFVAIILGSVLFGLDWQPAIMPPMRPIQVVALPPPAPVIPAPSVAVPKPSAQSPTAPAIAAAPKPAVPKSDMARPVAAAPVVPSAVAPVIAAPPNASNTATDNPSAPANSPAAQAPPKPLCDVAACAAAYRSFRESDCTYNPSFGPRQLCTKGVVPSEAATTPAAIPDGPASIMQDEPNTKPNSQTNAQPNSKCNVSACAAAYRSFTESDCTFLATGGQRKLCTK